MLGSLLRTVKSSQTMEYLMAAMWILLRHESNRILLSKSLDAGPTTARIAQLRDTIDVHDVHESMLQRKSLSGLGGITLQEGTPEDALIVVSTSEDTCQPTSMQDEVRSEMDMGESSWGLDTLVLVGKHWIPKLLQAEAGGVEDGALIKLFEFLIASMFLFLVPEDPDIQSQSEKVFIRAAHPGNSSTWWACPIDLKGKASIIPTLRDDGLILLTQILQLKQVAAYKCMTLAASTLWNYVSRSCEAERRAVQLGVSSSLHEVVIGSSWPACLRDVAAGCLCAFAENWENQGCLVGSLEGTLLELVRSDELILRLRGCHALARLTSKAPALCPQPATFLSTRKAVLSKAGGIQVFVGALRLATLMYSKLLERPQNSEPPSPKPLLNFEDSSQEYERDMQTPGAIIEIIQMVLCTLLNLSVSRKYQVALGKRGLMDLLATSFFFTNVKSPNTAIQQQEQRVLSVCNSILHNISSHPKNRTLIYKAELRCTAALEAALRNQQGCAHSSTLHRDVRPKAQMPECMERPVPCLATTSPPDTAAEAQTGVRRHRNTVRQLHDELEAELLSVLRPIEAQTPKDVPARSANIAAAKRHQERHKTDLTYLTWMLRRPLRHLWSHEPR
eukprot:jgi/Botrbrau1/11708/Bobra.0195s0037.1